VFQLKEGGEGGGKKTGHKEEVQKNRRPRLRTRKGEDDPRRSTSPPWPSNPEGRGRRKSRKKSKDKEKTFKRKEKKVE